MDRDRAPSQGVAPGKVRAPAARGLGRARLDGRMASAWEHRLVLVLAPAGSGKTTLLTHFAQTGPAPVAWYRAEGGDGAEAAFLAHLQQTVSAASGVAPTEPWAGVEDAARAIDLAGPLAVVVDDLHTLHGTPAEAALGRLVDYLPAGRPVLVGSRRAPSFSLSRLRVGGELLEIGADDLRFRPWEVEQLFRDVYGEGLSAGDVSTITRRTEGWAAGLQLFHLAVRGKPAAERARLVSALGPRSRLVREYLAENVLGGLPDDLRGFLVATSVLSLLSGELCDDLLGAPGSDDVLADLEARQLFTVALDDQGNYRYHEVLRSHLEAALVASVGETEARERYRQAGRLHEKAGQSIEAIRAYSRAEDWEAVGRLFGVHAEDLVSEPGAWVDTLPPALVAEDPWLMLASARRALAHGRLDAASAVFAKAEAAFGGRAGAEHARSERQALRPWLSDAPERAPGWSAVLRSATQRDPQAAVREAALLDGPLGSLVEGFALLLVGRANDAAARFELATTHQAASPVVAFTAGAARVLATWWGAPPPPDDAIDLDERAEDLGLPWAGRLAAAVVALAPDRDGRVRPNGLGVAEVVRRTVDAEIDEWGGAILALHTGLAAIHAHDDAVAILDQAVARLRFLGAPVLEVWAEAALAHALVDADRPGALDTAREVVTKARRLAVPGAAAMACVAAARVDPAGPVAWIARAAGLAQTAGVAVPTRLAVVDVPAALGAAPVVAVRRVGSAPPRIDDEPRPPLRLLGGFELQLEGRPVDATQCKPRVRALLQLLALHVPAAVHREVLCEALWPEADPTTGTRNLQVAVSSLRSLLEPGAGRGAHVVVVREGDAYRLVLPDGAGSDIGAVRTAAAEGRWTNVLELARGDVLPEAGPADWALGVRDEVRALVGAAALAVAQERTAQGDPLGAAAACERGLRVDRYQDRLWRTLADARRAAGDQAAAARAERDYAAVLADLGLA